ncbi:hypothetical protein Chls_378 [Chlamydia suis]|uniref:Uncharacterized protein n=1 Tax=Chlamydia suis TaxID=83559 RepID=A0ABX6IQ71_9CHLA|nr:hypothetical protein Chls_378 [Chlamydia suis]
MNGNNNFKLKQLIIKTKLLRVKNHLEKKTQGEYALRKKPKNG